MKKNFFKNPRLFYKYLASYVIILLIPLLLLSFIIQNYFVSVLDDEVKNNTLNKTIHLKDSVDTSLNKFSSIPIQIYENPDFKTFYLKNDPINRIKARKQLSLYTFNNNFIYELFYYIRGEENIISSESSYTLNTLYDDIYKLDISGKTTFLNRLNYIKKPSWFTMNSIRSDKNLNYNFITCMYPIPTNSNNPYATVMLLIDENKFKNLMSDQIESYGGNTVVLDNNLSIVTSLEDTNYLYSDAFKDSLAGLKDKGWKTVTLNEKKYLMCYVVSTDSLWTYINLVPLDSVNKKISFVKSLLNYGLLFIILIAGTLTYYFSYKNYVPIKKLKNVAEKEYGSLKNQDELKGLELAIIDMSNTRKNLTEKIDRSHEALKEFFLSSVLSGKLVNFEDFSAKAKDANVNFSKNNFRVVSFHIENNPFESTIDFEMILKEIENEIPPCIEALGRADAFYNNIVFILCHEDLNDNYLSEIMYNIQKCINDRFSIQVTIGMGNVYSDVKLISKSYLQSSTAIDYRLIKGSNTIILFNEFFNNSPLVNYYPQKDLELLELCVLQKDYYKLEKSLDSLIINIKKNNTPLFITKCLCYDIINIIIKSAYNVDKSYSNLNNKIDIIKLTKFNTVDDLADLVKEFCTNLYSNLRDNTKDSHEFIDDILKYINENYSKYDFSIQNTAENFNISQSNLCHYFKSKQGQTILGYINNLKIEKAKELLTTTDYSLKIIVEKIGYSDVSSFIKKFKGHVGLTPGDYRKTYGQNTYE